jgi:hypothetical protein
MCPLLACRRGGTSSTAILANGLDQAAGKPVALPSLSLRPRSKSVAERLRRKLDGDSANVLASRSQRQAELDSVSLRQPFERSLAVASLLSALALYPRSRLSPTPLRDRSTAGGVDMRRHQPLTILAISASE